MKYTHDLITILTKSSLACRCSGIRCNKRYARKRQDRRPTGWNEFHRGACGKCHDWQAAWVGARGSPRPTLPVIHLTRPTIGLFIVPGVHLCLACVWSYARQPRQPQPFLTQLCGLALQCNTTRLLSLDPNSQSPALPDWRHEALEPTDQCRMMRDWSLYNSKLLSKQSMHWITNASGPTQLLQRRHTIPFKSTCKSYLPTPPCAQHCYRSIYMSSN